MKTSAKPGSVRSVVGNGRPDREASELSPRQMKQYVLRRWLHTSKTYICDKCKRETQMAVHGSLQRAHWRGDKPAYNEALSMWLCMDCDEHQTIHQWVRVANVPLTVSKQTEKGQA